MPVSSARSINSASDMRAHTHAFLNSSQTFIAHASLLTRAVILVLAALGWCGLSERFLLGGLCCDKDAFDVFLGLSLLASASRVNSQPRLHHLNNDSKNSRNRSLRWFRLAHAASATFKREKITAGTYLRQQGHPIPATTSPGYYEGKPALLRALWRSCIRFASRWVTGIDHWTITQILLGAAARFGLLVPRRDQQGEPNVRA